MKRIVSKEIVEGFWICNHCQTKVPGTVRNCPNCGQPVDKNTSFDMDKENARVLSPEEAKNKGNGANWICFYCDSQNENELQYCKSCGAARMKSSDDFYYGRHQPVEEEIPLERKESFSSSGIQNGSSSKVQGQAEFRKIIFWIMLIFVGCSFFISFFRALTKPKEGIVKSFAWTSAQTVEEYKYVSDSSWDPPGNGCDVTETKEELYGYDRVKIGEETKTKTEYRREKVGSHYETEYEDNGDGTFTKITIEVDDYGSVPYEVTYTDPIYKDVPIYMTKYYYKEWRWVYEKTEYNTGVGKEVKDTVFTLKDNQRISGTHYDYVIYVEDEDGNETKYNCNDETWNTLDVGDKIIFKSVMGNVTSVEKVE